MNKKETYWVAGTNNQQYPIRLHCIHEAVRLCDQLTGGIVFVVYGTKPQDCSMVYEDCSIVYVQGESQYLGGLG